MIGLGVMSLLVMSVAWIFSVFSLRQPLVVAVDVAVSGYRILGAILALFWVQEIFARDIDRRVVLAIFAYPVPRSLYVLGRYAGIALLSLIAVTVWSFMLLILGHWASQYAMSSRPELGMGVFLLALGVWSDMLVIAAFMLFLVSFSRTRLLPMLIAGAFALAARAFGPVIDYLRFAADADEALQSSLLPLLERLRWVLPDLSRLDWREVMLYGHWPDPLSVFSAFAMAAGYVMVLLWGTSMIYERREFN